MQFKKLSPLLVWALLLNACTTKEYTKQESVFIVFKTPTFRHADLGFIYENEEEIKVEIYSSGQAVMSLEISQSRVCMSLLECMSKKSFNQKVLSATYPKSILNNIFQGKVIFSGLNVNQTRNGFTQKLMEANKYNINYSVLNKQILFRDTINDILIKVKRLD
jgi:hypothetical protein